MVNQIMGSFTLDAGKHRYSASPAFCESCVNLKITSSNVIVMDKDMHEVVRHKRLYGDDYERMDWLRYLTYIARKPRSCVNSGILYAHDATEHADLHG